MYNRENMFYNMFLAPYKQPIYFQYIRKKSHLKIHFRNVSNKHPFPKPYESFFFKVVAYLQKKQYFCNKIKMEGGKYDSTKS